MERACQLERLASRIYKVRSAQVDIGAEPVWQMYKDEAGHLESYRVTPQVLWGMMLCRRALYEDLQAPETAFAIVDKYMTLNDTL